MGERATTEGARELPAVLVVEDDPAFAGLVAAELRGSVRASVQVVASAAEAASRLTRPGLGVAVVDRRLPDGDGLSLLVRLRSSGSRLPVVLLTADGSPESVVEAMRAGAADYLVKGRASLDKLARTVGALLRDNPPERVAGGGADALVGSSDVMVRLRAAIRCCAGSRACVLIEGETGSGKELVARALHEESARAGGPFVAVNCGALPEQLVESELFGHVRGAFTGAHRDHPGLVEAAARGTLFLDEVEDLPPSLQGKLLRLLQESEYRPLGALRARTADVRIVAAANARLARLVAERRFRSDLFYRLNVLRIEAPPLRDRVGDLRELVAHFLARLERRAPHPSGAEAGRVAMPPPAALASLERHGWPGNVRELANLVERAAVFVATQGAENGWRAAVDELASGPDVPAALDGLGSEATRCRATASEERAWGGVQGPAAEEPAARELRRLLERHRWRREAAARELGVSRVTLWRRMRRLGLAGDEPLAAEPGDGDRPWAGHGVSSGRDRGGLRD